MQNTNLNKLELLIFAKTCVYDSIDYQITWVCYSRFAIDALGFLCKRRSDRSSRKV